MTFEKLRIFISQKMQMQHVYQPIMLMELLKNGGQVVGLTAPSPGWVVLDQTKVSSTLTMDSYNSDTTKKQSSGWMSSTLSVNMDTSQEVKLVGVLAGDVDGSWAG